MLLIKLFSFPIYWYSNRIIFFTYTDLPTISEQSTIIMTESNSHVKACFNDTGSPKPSMKIDQQANKIVNSFVEIDENCVYFVPQNVKDAKKVLWQQKTVLDNQMLSLVF